MVSGHLHQPLQLAAQAVWHFLSGRCKSLIFEGSGSGYLKSVCDYVHLNPARAKLVMVAASTDPRLDGPGPRRVEKRSHPHLRRRFVDIRDSHISRARLDIALGVRYNARMARRRTKRNFLVEANMKVFELSKAVVQDGFAEGAEVALEKTSYATALGC
jgi:hypothetical protein